MPSYTSYILQLLDIGCFALLKRVYKTEINVLANSNITYINKKAFLDTFNQVFNKAFLKDNIQSSFQATGLVLDPEVVLSRLEVKPYTPSPPLLGPTS
jgi:hypothetical protein